MKNIQIKIHPDGKIEAETRGMKGETCLKYIAEIERMADARTTDSAFTDEYYEREKVPETEIFRETVLHTGE